MTDAAADVAAGRPRTRLIREAAEALCALAVVSGGWLCAFARLSRFVPDPFLANACDLLNAALAPILLAMVLASLLAGLLRRPLGLTLLGITLAIALWQLAAGLADAAPRRSGADGSVPLRVLTVNAFHDNRDPERLRAVIEAAAPDIVLVQEGEGRSASALLRTLPRFHRALSCLTPPCSLMVLSRWPVQSLPKPMPPAHDLPDVLFAQVSVPMPSGRAQPIHVVAVHMPRGYRPIAAHFRKLLIGALRSQPAAPTIAAGDFNLPTGAAALSDVVRETGLSRADRWIATYPANAWLPAFAAIDHMFVAPSFSVRSCRRLPFTGSDHFGVACDLALPAR